MPCSSIWHLTPDDLCPTSPSTSSQHSSPMKFFKDQKSFHSTHILFRAKTKVWRRSLQTRQKHVTYFIAHEFKTERWLSYALQKCMKATYIILRLITFAMLMTSGHTTAAFPNLLWNIVYCWINLCHWICDLTEALDLLILGLNNLYLYIYIFSQGQMVNNWKLWTSSWFDISPSDLSMCLSVLCLC